MYVASASTTVKFHEFPTGNIAHNYQPRNKVHGPIKSISWSKDGNWLVLTPHSGPIEIITVKEEFKFLKAIEDVDEPTCVTFQNTTKKCIGIGTKSGLALIFDIKASKAIKRFPRVTSQITHLEFTSKDTHCVIACKNGDVLVYNNLINSPPTSMRVPKSSSISCLKTHKIKQNLILGGSNEGIVCIWDNNTNKVVFAIEAHKTPVHSLAFSRINNDLIATSGSDRRVCFFDIISNKIVGSISLDNSITALDFCPDGQYFELASQKGQIFIYDSRKITHHIHSFQAHSSTIKHLLFQNFISGNASICNISVESTVSPAEENLNIRSKRTSDMFRAFLPSAESIDGAIDAPNRIRSHVSTDGGDSFMEALGLDNNSTTDSVKLDDVFSKYPQAKIPVTITEASETGEGDNVTIPDKTEVNNLKEKQLTSTPVLQRASPNNKNVSSLDMKEFINNIIKDERNTDLQNIRTEMNEMANELKNEVKSEAMIIRRILYDTQMAMVKMSLKMEDWCNKLREEMLGENGRDISELLDENQKLKKKIELLEIQLKSANDKTESGSL